MRFVKRAAFLAIVAALIAAVYAIKKRRLEDKRKRRRTEIDSMTASISPSESIFVVIPSLGGGAKLAETVFSVFENAAHPFRVYVGVCQDVKSPADSFLKRYKWLAEHQGTHSFLDNIRVITGPTRNANGPSHARYLIENNLFRGERYLLHLDSGCTLADKWDLKAIADLHECPPKSILTGFPGNGSRNPRTPSGIRLKRYAGLVPVFASAPFVNPPIRPFPSLFWTARFSFSLAENLPKHDPYLMHLPAMATEFAHSARLWTHGYNFFTPSSSLAALKTSGRSRQRTGTAKRRFVSLQRVLVLLRVMPPASASVDVTASLDNGQEFGIGNQRPLKAYHDFTGVWIPPVRNREKLLKRAALKLNRYASWFSRMGVPSDAKTEHMIAAFGTMQAFHSESKRLQSIKPVGALPEA